MSKSGLRGFEGGLELGSVLELGLELGWVSSTCDRRLRARGSTTIASLRFFRHVAHSARLPRLGSVWGGCRGGGGVVWCGGGCKGCGWLLWVGWGRVRLPRLGIVGCVWCFDLTD